jgi:hypothetical protein
MRQRGRWHAALLVSLSRVQMSWLCPASFATWLYSSRQVDGLGVCLSTTAIFCGHWLTSHGLTTAWEPDLKPDTSWTALPSENQSCWAATRDAALARRYTETTQSGYGRQLRRST